MMRSFVLLAILLLAEGTASAVTPSFGLHRGLQNNKKDKKDKDNDKKKEDKPEPEQEPEPEKEPEPEQEPATDPEPEVDNADSVPEETSVTEVSADSETTPEEADASLNWIDVGVPDSSSEACVAALNGDVFVTNNFRDTPFDFEIAMANNADILEVGNFVALSIQDYLLWNMVGQRCVDGGRRLFEEALVRSVVVGAGELLDTECAMLNGAQGTCIPLRLTARVYLQEEAGVDDKAISKRTMELVEMAIASDIAPFLPQDGLNAIELVDDKARDKTTDAAQKEKDTSGAQGGSSFAPVKTAIIIFFVLVVLLGSMFVYLQRRKRASTGFDDDMSRKTRQSTKDLPIELDDGMIISPSKSDVTYPLEGNDDEEASNSDSIPPPPPPRRFRHVLNDTSKSVINSVRGRRTGETRKAPLQQYRFTVEGTTDNGEGHEVCLDDYNIDRINFPVKEENSVLYDSVSCSSILADLDTISKASEDPVDRVINGAKIARSRRNVSFVVSPPNQQKRNYKCPDVVDL